MDAILYSKYHAPHQRDATEFFNWTAGILDWYDLSKETIMDVGCGPGNTSCKWITTLFPEITKVIAIDSSSRMIEFAKVLNPNPKVQYFVADILDKSSLEVWEGKITKIVSTNCCQYVSDQEHLLRNVHGLLKSGGEATLLFEMTSSYFDCCEDMADSRWKEYSKNINFGIPASHAKYTSVSAYKNLLTEIGFEVVVCKKLDKTYEFLSDDECMGFLMSLSPIKTVIPNELQEEFSKDFYNSFVNRNGRNSAGQPIYHYSIIHILARKPNRRSLSSS